MFLAALVFPLALCDACLAKIIFQYGSVSALGGSVLVLLSCCCVETFAELLENMFFLNSTSLLYFFRRIGTAVSLCLTASSVWSFCFSLAVVSSGSHLCFALFIGKLSWTPLVLLMLSLPRSFVELFCLWGLDPTIDVRGWWWNHPLNDLVYRRWATLYVHLW